MSFTVIELEYINPPDLGAIFAVPIGTEDQALELYKWAASPDNDFSCTMTARLDGTQYIQVDGRTASTVSSPIGGDRWVVYNNGALTIFETAEEALTIYKLKGT